MKKLLALMMTMTLAFGVTACGGGEKAPAGDNGGTEVSNEAGTDDQTYQIGVIQFNQHPALDAANKGFFKALDDAGVKYKADQQNAAGEQSTCETIAETLVNGGNDLIFAIATPAAQAVAGKTVDIPIVLTAVTDPEESGLVDSNNVPGGNVTGTSDLTPIKEQMDLLMEILPETKKVGILYNSAEPNSVIQADMAKDALEKLSVEYTDYTVSSTNEIQTVVESAVGKVDALYVPTDNMIASGMPTVSMIANENGLPIICGEEGMVDQGGLATYGIDYFEVGYLAGMQAVEILTKGASPAEMPIRYLSPEDCKLAVNEETMSELEDRGVDMTLLGAKFSDK